MSNTSSAPIFLASHNAIPNKYLVRLNDDADVSSHLNWLQQRPNDGLSKVEVTNKFKSINGYGAELGGPVLNELANRPEVKTIAQDRQADW
ncbi:hypothetical protein RSOLAG22IIIB_12670 [Rhizoctonia solani]|uniref:Inhibitor I9 domain-containing protein n=1 Tax=Rhizoctonia solani TaxID=456999 RepID=A0A0K6GFN6_9AGAM|nr:hypothetical protein RSOLAG22IIIB_12670 [Rhizoctonia solani]